MKNYVHRRRDIADAAAFKAAVDAEPEKFAAGEIWTVGNPDDPTTPTPTVMVTVVEAANGTKTASTITVAAIV